MPNQRVKIKQLNVGFTLVELMITLAIAGMLATVAIPSFMGMVASSRVTAASNELVTALNMAKSEAIRSGYNTILCKSANGTECGGNWSDGWLLFIDANSDQEKQESEKVIRAHASFDSSLGFVFKTANYIEFRPNGHTNKNGHFCFRNSYENENSRAVYTTQSGRIRTQKVTGSSVC